MEEKLLQYISYNGLIMAGDRILIGVSGGADSLALLYFLKKYQGVLNIEIAAAHLNHEIRGKAAEEDHAFVKEFCFKQSVLLYDKSVDVIRLAKRIKFRLKRLEERQDMLFLKNFKARKRIINWL